MPLDRTHQHISTDIMQEDDPHTPIDPNGGGGGVSNPFTGDVDAGGFTVTNLGAPADVNDAVRVVDMLGLTLDQVIAAGNDAGGVAITNLADPADPQDAATKAYVDGVLTKATIDLDAADIATLNTVPVEVVAAPGAGKVIVPVAGSFQYKAGAVAFDLPSVVSCSVAANPVLRLANVGFDGLTSRFIFGYSTGAAPEQADVANVALIFSGDADPDGAGDGTARLTVLYYLMDLV